MGGPERRAWPWSRTGPRSGRSCPGCAPAWARWPRSRSPSPPTARAPSTASRRGARAPPPPPRQALEELVGDDELARFRQVAVVDAHGDAAAYTGEGCIAHAGHQEGHEFSAQANMMGSPEVWPAMAHAFEAATGSLARRLVAALHAAEARGGDARGRQSCALVVAPAQGEPWRRTVDLRVDDHPEPLAELDRLLDLSDAYALATEGDELVGQGRHEEAGERYRSASALAPGNHELLFWAGLAAAQSGDLPTALERVREAIRLQPGWHELLGRLDAQIAPGAPALLAALDESGQRVTRAPPG